MRYVLLILVVLMMVVGCSSEKKVDNNKTVVVEPKKATTAISGAVVVEDTKTEPAKVEVKKESKVEEVKKEVVAEKPKEEVKTQSNVIKVTASGFDPKELKVKVGETVEWKNMRTGKIDKALIVGAQNCYYLKSAILESGESFKYTFDKTDTCTIVEAITTTQVGKVIVE